MKYYQAQLYPHKIHVKGNQLIFDKKFDIEELLNLSDLFIIYFHLNLGGIITELVDNQFTKDNFVHILKILLKKYDIQRHTLIQMIEIIYYKVT